METNAVEEAVQGYLDDLDSAQKRGESAMMPLSRRLLVQWYPHLKARLDEEMKNIKDVGLA